MPYNIKEGPSNNNINVYATTQILQQIYSWTQKTFLATEVFPIYAYYYVQVNFSGVENRKKFEQAMMETFTA